MTHMPSFIVVDVVVVIEMANKITIDSSKQTNIVKNLTDNLLSESFVN
jgi:hypothetical protein